VFAVSKGLEAVHFCVSCHALPTKIWRFNKEEICKNHEEKIEKERKKQTNKQRNKERKGMGGKIKRRNHKLLNEYIYIYMT
jgi:hypothetical protein